MVGKDWTVFEELRIARPEPLPLVLSREQVARVLGVLRQPRYRVCLRLIYHCGLRVGEAVSLVPSDIHGRENPPRVHIKNAKGGKDRYVPIAAGMVQELRQWWRTHQNPNWLFPAQPKGGSAASAKSCMTTSSVQEAFALARQQSGIHPQATVHTLRHCYATQVLRQHWPQYERQFGAQILPSHRRALQCILNCRTQALGGQVYHCANCAEDRFVYHSCNHRACPRCGHTAATQWARRQKLK